MNQKEVLNILLNEFGIIHDKIATCSKNREDKDIRRLEEVLGKCIAFIKYGPMEEEKPKFGSFLREKPKMDKIKLYRNTVEELSVLMEEIEGIELALSEVKYEGCLPLVIRDLDAAYTALYNANLKLQEKLEGE